MVQYQFNGIPLFYGTSDESVEDFISNFDNMASLEYGKDNEAAKKELLELALRKYAQDWFVDAPTTVKGDYAQLCNNLRLAFTNMESQDQVWASLQGLRQGDQDYLTYEAEFIRKWNRGGFSSILPEFIMVDRFVEGLDPFLRAKVINSSPKSFKSAISIARYKHGKHSQAKIGSERHSYSKTIAPRNEYQIVELANPSMIPYLPLPIEHNFVLAHKKEKLVIANVKDHMCKAFKIEARDSVNHKVYEDSPTVYKLENSELEHEESKNFPWNLPLKMMRCLWLTQTNGAIISTNG